MTSRKKMGKNSKVKMASGRGEDDSELPSSAVSAEVSASAMNDNWTLQSALKRLEFVENENDALRRRMNYHENDIFSTLEVRLEDIKKSYNEQINSLFYEISEGIGPASRRLIVGSGSIATNGKGETFYAQHGRKEFVPRHSLFSIMLSGDENYRTIFNIVLTVLILWGGNFLISDMMHSELGQPNFDLLIWGVVRDLGPFSINWCLMFLATFFVIPLAHVAAEAYDRKDSNFLESAVFYACMIIYTAIQLSFFLFSKFVVSSRSIPFSMPLAVGFMCEQARMSMKMHSYFREKLLCTFFNYRFACRPMSEKETFFLLHVPEIKYLIFECEKYFYFLGAPTLLYRDSYPNTTRIKWMNVISLLLQALCIVYFTFLVFRSSLPQFEENVGEPLTRKLFLQQTFSCMGSTMACMIFCHYLVLHLVQNIGAELTRFADRQFYQAWWNSRTFSVFYREWNGVVHDFIHSYIYTDLRVFGRLPKLVSLLLSFGISAVVHEYIIAVSMGFFLPILLFLFTGPGLVFILLTHNKTGRVWNLFMWIMLATGNAMLMVLYCREYYARDRATGAGSPNDVILNNNAHVYTKGTDMNDCWDFFVPRTLLVQLRS